MNSYKSSQSRENLQICPNKTIKTAVHSVRKACKRVFVAKLKVQYEFA